jgi:hypothetical protein
MEARLDITKLLPDAFPAIQQLIVVDHTGGATRRPAGAAS